MTEWDDGLVEAVAERVVQMLVGDNHRVARKEPSTKFQQDPREFDEALHHALGVVGDTYDAKPTLENVGKAWHPLPLSVNTLRKAMKHHGLVTRIGGQFDFAGVLKRLFREQHPLLDKAAIFLIGLPACADLLMDGKLDNAMDFCFRHAIQ